MESLHHSRNLVLMYPLINSRNPRNSWLIFRKVVYLQPKTNSKQLMGKLALILGFILSVFPADTFESRRHIHVVRKGSKRSHRGNTVAKIWIEREGQKDIEIAWSELSSAEEEVISEL